MRHVSRIVARAHRMPGSDCEERCARRSGPRPVSLAEMKMLVFAVTTVITRLKAKLTDKSEGGSHLGYVCGFREGASVSARLAPLSYDSSGRTRGNYLCGFGPELIWVTINADCEIISINIMYMILEYIYINI